MRAKAVGPLRAKAILSRSEARMDFAVPCRGRRREVLEMAGNWGRRREVLEMAGNWGRRREVLEMGG